MSSDAITVVGAGMAGAACARTLSDAGLDVRVLDRGRAAGGRMSSPRMHGRRVDTGAGYFTVRDDGFAEVVHGWRDRGLAREWTDTFGVLTPGGEPSTKHGPMRWATPEGLRSLVHDLLTDIDVTSARVESLPPGEVVVAMPDPQASRLIEVPDAVDYEPVISAVCAFADPERTFADSLPFVDAAFVNDHPDITFVAHDGARRGDGAAVLVVHTTAERARESLHDPTLAVAPVSAAIQQLCGVAAPAWAEPQRWTFARPAATHDRTYGVVVDGDGRTITLIGDQWCPDGSARVESAWRSGVDAAHALLQR